MKKTELYKTIDNKSMRKLVLSLHSVLKETQSKKISEGTKAGMARARARGIRVGRRPINVELQEKIMVLNILGETPYAIGKALGIDRHTAAKYVKALK